MNHVISLMGRGALPLRAHQRGALLTSEQKEKATEIAARFDPKIDDPEMRQEMREAFDAANIRPGEDLRNVLRDAGFKLGRPPHPSGDGPQGGRGQHRGPRNLGPPPGLPKFVLSFMEKRREGSVGQAETQQFMADLRRMPNPPKGLFVNRVA